MGRFWNSSQGYIIAALFSFYFVFVTPTWGGKVLFIAVGLLFLVGAQPVIVDERAVKKTHLFGTSRTTIRLQDVTKVKLSYVGIGGFVIWIYSDAQRIKFSCPARRPDLIVNLLRHLKGHVQGIEIISKSNMTDKLVDKV